MRATYRSLVVLLSLSSFPAFAGIIAGVGADNSLTSVGADTDGDPAFVTADQGGAHAEAAGDLIAHAHTYLGLPPCSLSPCGAIGLAPSAFAAAHVNARRAYLRAIARSGPGSNRAIATGVLVDTLTFDSPIEFDIHFDLNALEIDDDASSASITFTLGIQSDNEVQIPPFFGINAYVDLEGRTGGDVHEHVIVSPQDFFPFPVPPGTEFTGTFLMGLTVEVLGRGIAAADQSVTIGITGDYTSANGYSYPGLVPTGAVPEPATAWLAGVGLAVAAWARHRSRFRRC